MGADISELAEGQIVWAIVRDRNGFRQRRPAILLTPTAEIIEDQPLVLVAVTTTFPQPAPSDHIELP